MSFDCKTYTCSIENVDIKILVSSESFAQNKCADHQKPFHTHVYYELLLSSVDGSGALVCCDERIPLNASGVALITPGCSHRTVIHRPESLVSLGFLFAKRRTHHENTQDLYTRLGSLFEGVECLCATLPTHLSMLGVQLAGLASNGSLLDGADFCASFLHLLCGVLKVVEQGNDLTVYKKQFCMSVDRGRRLPVELASTINSILANEFTSDITPDALSKRYYISVKQINRYVYSQYGMTFLQRRNDLRMTCAARLLCESEGTIADIARQVGYESVNSFYSAFSKRFGKTPSEYRKEITN